MKFQCPHCKDQHEDTTDLCPNTGFSISRSYRRLGRTLAGKYRLVSLLGEGGMGAVYRAEHVEIGKVMAVKVLHEKFAVNREMVERFIREAKAAAKVGHEHIIDVYDVGREPDDTVFMVQELLQGETLEGMLRRGTFGYETSCHIMMQTLSALSAAHSMDIIHRDLKPENLFLTKVGEQPYFIKVLDFGLAKIRVGKTQHGLTQSGAMMGTPIYMSPEQVQGSKDIDHRTDIYSCGVILYKMLTGRLPFDAPSLLALCFQITQSEAKPVEHHNHHVPMKLSFAVKRALAKKPGERFQSCKEMADELRPFAAHDLTKFHYFVPDLEGRTDTVPQGSSTPLSWSRVDIDEGEYEVGSIMGDASADTPSGKGEDAEPAKSGSAAKRTGTSISVILGGLGGLVGIISLVVLVMVIVMGERRQVDEEALREKIVAELMAKQGLSKEEAQREAAKQVEQITQEEQKTKDEQEESKEEAPPAPADGEVQTSEDDTVLEENKHGKGKEVSKKQKTQKEVVEDGYLTIDSKPWTMVYIDFKRVGLTPLRKHKLPPGEHKISLLNNDHNIKETFTTTIVGGQVKRIKRNYLDDSSPKNGKEKGEDDSTGGTEKEAKPEEPAAIVDELSP